MPQSDSTHSLSMNPKRKKPNTDGYLLGAFLPLAFYPFAFLILPGSSMGSFIPVFTLMVPAVIGMTCCVQGFRKSSNGWMQTACLLLGFLYMIPFLLLSMILSGPLQN